MHLLGVASEAHQPVEWGLVRFLSVRWRRREIRFLTVSAVRPPDATLSAGALPERLDAASELPNSTYRARSLVTT
jgi:hypothetical protein